MVVGAAAAMAVVFTIYVLLLLTSCRNRCWIEVSGLVARVFHRVSWDWQSGWQKPEAVGGQIS